MSNFVGIERGHSQLYHLSEEMKTWPAHELYSHRQTEAKLLRAIAIHWGADISASYAQRGFGDPKHEELMKRIQALLDEMSQV